MTSLRMTRPLGKTDDPAYGLAQPAALLTLKAKSGDGQKVYTLAVGAKDAADSSYVVKLSDSPYYVRVAEFSVKDLVEKKRDGFLQVPSTAQPSRGRPPRLRTPCRRGEPWRGKAMAVLGSFAWSQDEGRILPGVCFEQGTPGSSPWSRAFCLSALCRIGVAGTPVCA